MHPESVALTLLPTYKMALVQNSNSVVVSLTSNQVSKALGQVAAEIGVNYLDQFSYKKQDLLAGKQALENLFTTNHNFQFSNTYCVIEPANLDRDVDALANAKEWSTKFAEKIKVLARLSGEDHEARVKFCTDTTSNCALHAIATLHDEKGNYHIKVIFVAKSFTLSPKTERFVLEDKEPVYVTKTTGWYPYNGTTTTLEGFKTHQRVEERVVPQLVQTGAAENIQDYLLFKMAKAVAIMHPQCLENSPEAKQMLTWD